MLCSISAKVADVGKKDNSKLLGIMTGANVPCICELGIIACQACQWYFQACIMFYSLSCAVNCIDPLRCLQVLLNNRPEATTALLMQLCTPGDSSKPDGDWIAKVSDFAHLAADRYTAAVFVILPTLLPTGILLLSVCCQ